MEKNLSNKIVIFGAGKIGRSFIGQLFSKGDFEVVFIDISDTILNELNQRGMYEVVIKSEVEKTITVKNVRGVDGRDKELVSEEVSDSTIIAVSVGLKALPIILTSIAEGLKKRYEKDQSNAVDIIIAENMRNGSQYFRENLKNLLPESYPLNDLVGLVETSIGKMVPIIPENIEKENPLIVFAEPYNTLILDKRAFKNPIPKVEGLAPKDNIKAWVDRKLFIHNLGHAATAYWGYYYNPKFQYIWEALEVPTVFSNVRETMLQSANLLAKRYSDDFSIDELVDHVDDLLFRFKNKALADTIYRVGCDLSRKLGPNDRLAGAIRLAISLNMPYDKILKTLIVGCQFKAVNEKGMMHPSDIAFFENNKSLTYILENVCSFDRSNFPQVLLKAQEIEKSDFIK